MLDRGGAVLRAAVLYAAAVSMLAASCVKEPGAVGEAGELVLEAGKLTTMTVPIPPGLPGDSLYTGAPGSTAIVNTEAGRCRLQASLAVCASPEDRLAQVLEGGAGQAEIQQIETRSGVFRVVLYSSGDSSFVERLWPRGGGEHAMLRASMLSDAPRMVLSGCRGILTGASLSQWTGLRSVVLSDRGLQQILDEAGSGDVSPPPEVRHRISISIDPGAMLIGLSDTFEIDFHQIGDSASMSLFLPHIDGTAPETLEPVAGSLQRLADSVSCRADSAGLFRGVYSTSIEGFYTERDGFVTGQTRLSSSFCSGEWLYPGAGVPSSYLVTAVVPTGLYFYCPLDLEGSSSTGVRTTFEYRSPEGGVSGPLSWALDDFDRIELAGGRGSLLYGSGTPSDDLPELADLADMLATTVWDLLGFDGGRFDVVLVTSLDRPVLSAGPGCLLVSPERLLGLGGYEGWPDSVSNGQTPVYSAVVAEAATAMLSLSSYLPAELEAALSVYAVCRFESDWGSDGSADSLLEACRLYYLNETSTTGGVEYAFADPLLSSSPLSQPVILGKAPCMLGMFSETIPGFDDGLSRALSALRHSGYGYGRLASAIGESSSGDTPGFYWPWVTTPGVPQILVSWADSSGRVVIDIDQLQPGPEFPLPLGRVDLYYSSGIRLVENIVGPDSRGRYHVPSSSWAGSVVRMDVAPGLVLPADLIYERRR